MPELTVSPDSQTIYSGQPFVLASNASYYGTSGFAYQWFNDTGTTSVAVLGANLSDYNGIGGAPGSFVYYLVAYGSAGVNSVSNNALLMVNASTTTSTTTLPTTTASGGGSGGGGGGGGGGASGGGGSANFTSVTSFTGPDNETGHSIRNFMQDGTERFTIGGKSFITTLNFIGPNDTGVTINGHSYTLTEGSPVLIDDPPSVGYFANLTSIGYLPILHWVNMTVFEAPLATTATSNTTISTSTSTAEAISTAQTVSTTLPTTSVLPVVVPSPAPAAAQPETATVLAEFCALAAATAAALVCGRWLLRENSDAEDD